MEKEEGATPAAPEMPNKDSNNLSNNERIEVNIPKNTKLDSTLFLPTWGVPHLEKGIYHVSNVYGCSPDFVVASQMTAISAAIGKNIKSDDGKFKNYPMTWNMIVGQQGTCKSEPLTLAMQPLFDINNEMYQEYKRQKDIWVEGMPEPIYEQIIVGDTTPEYLHSLMGKGHAVTCYFDEIANLEENFNRYNKSDEATTLLTISSGKQISVNRKNGEPVLIPNPFLNITGTIQPETLNRIYGKEVYINNGYLARWLFVYPENQAIQMYNENVVDEAVLKRYDTFIRDIAKSKDLGVARFTSGAKKLYANYYNTLQKKKANATDGYEAGIYSKLQIHVQRWALITLTARLFGLNEKMEISEMIMQYSIDCMGYFEHTALKVHDMILLSRTHRNPTKIIGKEDAIRIMAEHYPEIRNNITSFAKCIGKSHPFVSQTLKRK